MEMIIARLIVQVCPENPSLIVQKTKQKYNRLYIYIYIRNFFTRFKQNMLILLANLIFEWGRPNFSLMADFPSLRTVRRSNRWLPVSSLSDLMPRLCTMARQYRSSTYIYICMYTSNTNENLEQKSTKGTMNSAYFHTTGNGRDVLVS
jgi:hypothetical protein